MTPIQGNVTFFNKVLDITHELRVFISRVSLNPMIITILIFLKPIRLWFSVIEWLGKQIGDCISLDLNMKHHIKRLS